MYIDAFNKREILTQEFFFKCAIQGLKLDNTITASSILLRLSRCHRKPQVLRSGRG